MSKALVVDDSKAIRMILARTLRELGYEVWEAANGKEALAAIQAGANESIMKPFTRDILVEKLRLAGIRP